MKILPRVGMVTNQPHVAMMIKYVHVYSSSLTVSGMEYLINICYYYVLYSIFILLFVVNIAITINSCYSFAL